MTLGALSRVDLASFGDLVGLRLGRTGRTAAVVPAATARKEERKPSAGESEAPQPLGRPRGGSTDQG